ncbi:MAG: tetratricopeptide repeat protein [Clostridiales bacterium]|nr:tetratricopeptide repeat protein [Clostridiales bacterium]
MKTGAALALPAESDDNVSDYRDRQNTGSRKSGGEISAPNIRSQKSYPRLTTPQSSSQAFGQSRSAGQSRKSGQSQSSAQRQTSGRSRSVSSQSRSSGRAGAGAGRSRAMSGQRSQGQGYTSADPRAKVRQTQARRRRRRKKQIRRILSLLLLVVILVAGVIGVRGHLKNKKIEEYTAAGIAAVEDGENEEAVTYFDQALELVGSKLGKSGMDILERRAEALYEIEEYDQALESWQRLIEADPDNEEYKENAVLCMLETGDYEEALKLGVLQSRIYNKMALEKLAISDYEGALSVIQQGMAVDDGSAAADLAYNQAVAYEYRGEYEKALELFEEYIARFGSDENVEKEITFLQSRTGDSSDTESEEESQEE